MLSIGVNPGLDRQFSPLGPVLLWRDGDRGAREGLLLVLHPCPFPTCPDRHVDVAVYRLSAAVSVVEVDAERVWAVGRHGAADRLEPDFTASIELEDDSFAADSDAAPELLAWIDRELDGELLGVVKEQFAAARRRGEAALRRPPGPP